MKKLEMTFNEKCPVFRGENFEPIMDGEADFWRLHADNGIDRELGIYSSEQTFTKIPVQNGYDVLYDGLKAENGKLLDIKMTVHIKNTNGRISYSADIQNNCEYRLNELQLPVVEFDSTGVSGEEEYLYIPAGLGWRQKNPRKHMAAYNHTEYMAADYKNCWLTSAYPSTDTSICATLNLSMCWCGIQAGENFLYVSSEDTDQKVVNISVGIPPRHHKSKILFAVSHFPALEKGENIETEESVFCVFKGDWRNACEYYKTFCSRVWYTGKNIERPEWVKNMTGWQRVILKHQYGEILYKYEDLPKLYADGARYGLNTILVFGWWKGCFDNHYPEYEVDPELGGEQALRDAVKEIHDMGGKVLLYSNGNLIDVKTDYYKKTGQRICTKDIDLNECREHYRFSNNGTLLHCYGHKSFVTACHNPREWQEQLVNIGTTKLSFGADCIFYDQLGINSKLCFDKSHPHGNRIDTEPQARYENIWKIREILSDDQAIGTEWAVDRYACSVDFIHGCGEGFAYIGVNMFPDMFLNTFPECVMSNRFIHDDKDGFEQHLNYAFVFGLVFDVSIYRGRGSISDCPRYGEYVKKLIDLKEKYHKFFYGGKFISAFDSKLPSCVFAAVYECDNERIIAVCNNNYEEKEFTVCGKKITLSANEVAVIEQKG